MQKVVIVAGKLLLRRLGRILAVLVLVLLLATCVEEPPAGPVPALVDGKAAAAVLVDSPFALFQALDSFWNSAGIQAVAGSDLQGLLRKSLPNADAAAAALDFARPWALSFIPLSPDSKETRTVVCLPVRDANAPFLKGLGDQAGMKLVAQASGYLVFATGDGPVEFPPSHPLDLRRLSAYPAASIKAWADPSFLHRLTMDEWKPMESAARRFVSGEEGGQEAAKSAVKSLGLALLAQLGGADAAIVPDASGISFRIGTSLVPGSDLERFARAAAAAPSALDWSGRVRSDAFYGYAWSLAPTAIEGLYGSLVGPALMALGLDRATADRVTALEKRWAGVSGPRGAASFDFALDAHAIAGLDPKAGGPDDFAKALVKAMKINLDIAEEVQDGQRYAELLRGVNADPDFQAIAQIYRDKLGLDFQITTSDQSEGDFAFGLLRFAFAISDPKKFAALAQPSSGTGTAAEIDEAAQAGAKAVLEALGDLMRLRWTVADGRFVATTGDAASLKALAAQSAASPSLADDPAFSSFAKTLPATPLSVGYLSMRRLAQFVRDLAAESAPGTAVGSIDPSRLGSWYGYLSAGDASPSGPASMETGCFVPASDIKYLIQIVGALGKQGSQAAH